ncbi:MAG TPA: HAD family phosphatase [Methylomirabilota bacterium]|nr:HAD family phosphatase [Methylomirabilota bacterium]
MTRPGAIVFDLGKVLVDFDYGIAARRLAERSRLAAREVQSVIDHSPLLFRYETGQLDRAGFFAEIRAAIGYEGSLDEFSQVFADIFTPIVEMIELHARLRQRGFPTFIFSNTNDLAVAHIHQHFPFFATFDGYVLSYQQGSMKPNPQIYEAVERLTGLRGDRLLYLDDRPENVAAGAARGWHVIQQISPADTWARIRELGLL